MRRSLVWKSLAGIVLPAVALCATAQAQLAVRPIDQEQAARGKIMFERQWTIRDPLSPRSDGLGPMHNANSCVACHVQGSVGGGGPNEKNVLLLTLSRKQALGQNTTANSDNARISRALDPQAFSDFTARVNKFHSNFMGTGSIQSSVILHRFGSTPDYERWRDQILGVPTTLEGAERQKAVDKAYHRLNTQHVTELSKENTNSVAMLVSQRNTPALFGAHLIDSIPADAIRLVAKEQAKLTNGVQGRVPPSANKEVGRFGWRGQTATLRDFVHGACAIELGLSTPITDQLSDPRVPVAFDPFAATRNSPPQPKFNVDLTEDLCNDLIEFCASLSAPQQQRPLDKVEAEYVDMGQAHFHAVGCADCHIRTVAHVEGLYSDLLLHNMGPNLADPVPGVSENLVPTYYGGSSFDIFARSEPPKNLQDWRTPPLWGVADSAPYLHDGRATTLEEAILAHGGEADDSVRRYRELHHTKRARLIAFLSTLRAPGVQVVNTLVPTPASRAKSRAQAHKLSAF